MILNLIWVARPTRSSKVGPPLGFITKNGLAYLDRGPDLPRPRARGWPSELGHAAAWLPRAGASIEPEGRGPSGQLAGLAAA